MTVKLDLRPDRLDASGERAAKAANSMLFFSVCLFLFSLAALSIVSSAALYRVRNAERFEAVNKEYEARIAAAEGELKSLALRNANIAADLEFVFGGVDAFELLGALSASLSDDIALQSVELTPQSALIKGFAQSDASVLAFAESLAHRRAVGSVGVPSIASTGDGELKSFSIDLKLRDIRTILLSSADLLGSSRVGWTAA